MVTDYFLSAEHTSLLTSSRGQHLHMLSPALVGMTSKARIILAFVIKVSIG